MCPVRKTILEMLILGVVGAAVAVAVNGVRASSSVKWSRDYFDKGKRPDLPVPSEPSSLPLTTSGKASLEEPRGDLATVGRIETFEQASVAQAHPRHPYQEITFKEVVAVFNSSETAAGVNVFVDARDLQAYEEGHIPGAIQADHYRLEDYIETLLDYAESAERIIVYCNGGNCEDSIFLCADLMDFDIPYERLFLYPGGWEEWNKRGLPVKKGLE